MGAPWPCLKPLDSMSHTLLFELEHDGSMCCALMSCSLHYGLPLFPSRVPPIKLIVSSLFKYVKPVDRACLSDNYSESSKTLCVFFVQA